MNAIKKLKKIQPWNNINWGKDNLFTIWCWESWTLACKSKKLEHTFTPGTKINSKWLSYLNVIHDTIKLWEGSTGKTSSDINCNNAFLGQSPKATEIKSKINKWDLLKLISFGMAKEAIKNKITYGIGENICKWCDWQQVNLQNIKIAHTIQW